MSHQHSTNKHVTTAVMLVLTVGLVTVSQVDGLRLAMHTDSVQTGWDPETSSGVSLNFDLHDVHDALSQQRDYATDLRDFVTKHDGKTCLSVSGHFMGGLSNTMAFINVMLEAAWEVGATPKWPKVKPGSPDHPEAKNAFQNFFASESCNQKIEVYSAHCNEERRGEEVEKKWNKNTNYKKSQCIPSQSLVENVSEPRMVEWCGCDRLVLLNAEHLKWHFDYSKTGPYIRDEFWAAHPSQFMLPNTNLKSPGSDLISVVMHVRLGDLLWSQNKGKFGEKRTGPAFYINALKSLEELFHQDAMHVTIVTENPSHHDVQMIKLAARVKVTIQTSSAENDFFTMAYSDILIAGGSGFSRLAAVLQVHTQPSFRIVTKTDSHPLSFLTDTITVPNRDDAISISPETPSIAALIKRSAKKLK